MKKKTLTSIQSLLSNSQDYEKYKWAILQHHLGVSSHKLKILKSILVKEDLQSIDDLEEFLDRKKNESKYYKEFLDLIEKHTLDSKVEQKIWKLIEKKQIITIIDSQYPPLLWEIDDPPVVIVKEGDMPDMKESVAIVGRRNASANGYKIAYEIGQRLGQKATVVSGLAYGIDVMAHVGCLSKNGRAVAVLGTPIDEIYPKHHETIFYEIVNTGAALSDIFVRNTLLRRSFSMRNRIISGISRVVIVVETNEKGGTIKQMEYAKHQNKPILMYVPTENKLAEKIADIYGAKKFSCISELDELLSEYI